MVLQNGLPLKTCPASRSIGVRETSSVRLVSIIVPDNADSLRLTGGCLTGYIVGLTKEVAMAQVLTENGDFVQDYQDVVDGESTSGSNHEYEAWFRRKVEAGEQAYREGRFISKEEETRRAEVRQQMLLKMLDR